jgi:regulator of chromosome condensation
MFRTMCALVPTARLLIPQIVKIKGKAQFTDVFCGAYFTFAVSKEGNVYGFGLSNYHQLGVYETTPDTIYCYLAMKCMSWFLTLKTFN